MYEFIDRRLDREILRRLAGEVAQLASSASEDEKRDLWYRHNDLESMRPVVFCDPENGWGEIIPRESLQCEIDQARFWEMALRREVFWGTQIRDDRVITPFFDVPHVYEESDWGLPIQLRGGHDGGAYTWLPPIQTYDDAARLKPPVITVDWAETNRMVEMAQELFGDLLTVRLRTPTGITPGVVWAGARPGAWWWSMGMTELYVKLRGLGELMIDLVDRPADVHRTMAFLRDAHLAKLDYLESSGLLFLNNDGTYVGSGGFGWTRQLPQPDFDGHVRACDMWGFSESQETVGISPSMFEEFIFPYQLPILERFGLNCYGCCEPLDKRWHVVQRIPRLRRVSVSAWAKVPVMAEMLSDRYVFSWKPTPTDLAMDSFEPDTIRQTLRRFVQQTRGCRVEIIMKDNHTIRNDPRRVTEWARIAREEAESA